MKGEYKGRYFMPRFSYQVFMPAVALAIALSSCAHTKIINAWKDPEYQGHPKKVLVHGMARNPDVIAVFENLLVDEFKKRGITALAGYRFLSDDVVVDKEAIKKLVKEQGIDTLFVAGPRNIKELQTLRPGSVSYSAGVYADPDGDFIMAAAGFSYKPGTYAEEEGTWEAVLYDVGARKRVWSVQVETYVSDTRMEEVRPAVEKVMARLLADKMIP
jgi:hypothetical protein